MSLSCHTRVSTSAIHSLSFRSRFSFYVGWVDAKSGDPVDNKDIKTKY